jgi:predicted amidophosphoribosyltransferase
MAQLFWHLTPVERAAAMLFYEPHSEMARIVYDMKYHDRPDIGEDMGRLMANEMQFARYFDGIDV